LLKLCSFASAKADCLAHLPPKFAVSAYWHWFNDGLPLYFAPMNIGVFLPNWIGDVAMAVPTLRALRQKFPAPCRLIGVMRPYVADVLAGTSWLDEQLFYLPKSKDPGLGNWAVTKRLRERRLDVAVLLTNSLRTGIMAWLSGARRRVGYARSCRGMLLTHKLYHPRSGRKWLPTPAIDSYLQLAYALGCPAEPPDLELPTLAADEAAADRVWTKFRLPQSGVAVLNSGGAFGAAKCWPSEHFAELARRIAEEQSLAVLVNCGPAEKPVAAEIVRQAAHPRVVSLADEPVSIGLSKACVARGRVLVTTDSGPRFFGIAAKIPVVTLFGPTDEAWTRTHAAHEVCLSEAVPCGPCGQRTCPLQHHRCMRDLSVDRVYAAVVQQLEHRRPRHVA